MKLRGKLVIYLMLIVVVTVVFFFANAFRASLKYDTYRTIRIGMTEDEAMAVLLQRNVRCEFGGLPTVVLQSCEFSDYFRNYHIGFDSNHTVSNLWFSFKRGHNLLLQ